MAAIISSRYCQYAARNFFWTSCLMVWYRGSFLVCSRSLFLMRRFNERDTYSRQFLELVNLCGINRLIPEVNSSRKLDHKSFIGRSQSVECTTESSYLDMCSKSIPVCFSIQGNHPAFCLVNVALILPSKNTASWSLIPGMTWVLTIRLSLLVINKSTTFLPRVGLVISWTQPWSSRQSANFRVNSGKRHVGNRQLCFQSNPGRFMSPAIRIWDEVQICDEVSHSNRWSDLSKFFLLLRAWTPNLLDEANW